MRCHDMVTCEKFQKTEYTYFMQFECAHNQRDSINDSINALHNNFLIEVFNHCKF